MNQPPAPSGLHKIVACLDDFPAYYNAMRDSLAEPDDHAMTVNTLLAHLRTTIAAVREQQAALKEMEEGYRRRCNFCRTSLSGCEEAAKIPGACLAPSARAVLAKYALEKP